MGTNIDSDWNTGDWKMHTLGVLVIYDPQGIIDDYLIFYTKSLIEAVEDLIIVINGNVEPDGYKNLLNITDKIIVRENKGYDAGGYKAALNEYGEKFFLKYDQVVFSNDTCFGPFIPFKTIFERMNKEEGDFWGFEYLDNDLFSIMGTFFIVFRKSVVSDVYDFFIHLDTDNMSRNDVVRIAELGLFHYLVGKGYKLNCFSSVDNYDMYKSPNFCTIKCGVPIMKKRCFDPIKYHKDNCIDLLKYLFDSSLYNVQYILDVVDRKYNIKYDLEYEFKRNLSLEEIKIPCLKTLKEILGFINNAMDVYIYGAGMYGKYMYERLKDYMNITGFVLSDDQYVDDYINGVKVYRYSDLCLDDCKVIVAIKESNEIRSRIGNHNNILYLF